MIRYSVIRDKNPREILLLRGAGCRWRRCAFCDYHLDGFGDPEEDRVVNRAAMDKVTGQYGRLEVINSGSFPELGEQTLSELRQLCRDRGITTLHFECHWLYRAEIPRWRDYFRQYGVALRIKTGVETFDFQYRETVLQKGIRARDPAEIARDFDECCLLFGLTGQTEDSMRRDIETGLEHFDRVCVNIFQENTTGIKPDPAVIAVFQNRVMPDYINCGRVDILLHNTDFGVGGEEVPNE